jgi:lysophospholipid acyltransferase (LPLAT)-like uncharacterized protein
MRTLGGRGLALYGALIRATASFSARGTDHLQQTMAGAGPTILSTWHGQTHLLLGYLLRTVDLSRLVLICPDDHRRQVLESFAHSLGASAFAVGMSDESLAGARRLLRLVQSLPEQGLSYICPDGPDGPARVPKPGIAFVAEKTQASVLPIGTESWPCLRQRRWDRYILPMPFARVAIAFRPPIPPPRKGDRDAWLLHLSRELTAAREDAIRLLHPE